MSGADPCTGSKIPGALSPRLAEAARPRACEVEPAACDPFDLCRRVLAGVEGAAVLAPAAGAEVEAADELAHDEQVDPAVAGGAQVRVDVELAAKPEEPLLGPDR